jgi:hypothetical protein
MRATATGAGRLLAAVVAPMVIGRRVARPRPSRARPARAEPLVLISRPVMKPLPASSAPAAKVRLGPLRSTSRSPISRPRQMAA